MKTQLASVVLGTYIAIVCNPLECSATQPNFFSQLGVNLAGAEFGSQRESFSNENPGRYTKEYIYPCKRTMEYFASNGIKLFRIPFRWERIQPKLGQPLDQEELKKLQAVARDAATLGVYVILDLHNYARYRTKKDGKVVVHIVGDKSLDSKPAVTVNNLCDLWRRLAGNFDTTQALSVMES